MITVSKREPLLLVLGDAVFMYAALWLMLLIRYADIPTRLDLDLHLLPFSILFLVWIAVFFVAGLYEKHTVILKRRLPGALLRTQVANSIIAVLFFYFLPFFLITPKVNLFIYLVVSFGLLLWWRLVLFGKLGAAHKEHAVLVGSGEEMKELLSEVNNNTRYGMKFVSSVDLDDVESTDFADEVVERVYSEDVSLVAVDLRDEKAVPILPKLYNLMFSKVRFVDMHRLYEDIFDRVPLSLVKYSWFLENVSTSPSDIYDFAKRAMDVTVAALLGLVSLVFYPFVMLAIKLDDGGPVFIVQERIGRNNVPVRIVKFRSMSVNDDGATEKDKEKKITRVGSFIRKTRIDELPQLWNVLRGDLSLIGPRPELPALARKYEEGIPYYNVRHLIKPGLSGWAQLYHKDPPKFDVGFDQTRMKLSYDLYYIKNRSFTLDLKIALRTIAALLSRSGV